MDSHVPIKAVAVFISGAANVGTKKGRKPQSHREHREILFPVSALSVPLWLALRVWLRPQAR